MNTPIIMAAFGTSSSASSTYEHLDEKFKDLYPGHDIYWAYTSRMIKNMALKKSPLPKHPHEILQQLLAKGHNWAVVQSLHLTPGYEFYRLQQEVSEERIRVSLGMPLLYSPHDYQKLGECLAPLFRAHPEEAIVLIGHGTNHHAWSTYPALEVLLRKQFGEHIYVGVTEEYPPRRETVAEVVAAGHKKVFMIPLLLVAGMHFQRDVMGTEDSSWKTLFEKEGISVTPSSQGLGSLPGVDDILCSHINEALDIIP